MNCSTSLTTPLDNPPKEPLSASCDDPLLPKKIIVWPQPSQQPDNKDEESDSESTTTDDSTTMTTTTSTTSLHNHHHHEDDEEHEHDKNHHHHHPIDTTRHVHFDLQLVKIHEIPRVTAAEFNKVWYSRKEEAYMARFNGDSCRPIPGRRQRPSTVRMHNRSSNSLGLVMAAGIVLLAIGVATVSSSSSSTSSSTTSRA